MSFARSSFKVLALSAIVFLVACVTVDQQRSVAPPLAGLNWNDKALTNLRDAYVLCVNEQVAKHVQWDTGDVDFIAVIKSCGNEEATFVGYITDKGYGPAEVTKLVVEFRTFTLTEVSKIWTE